MKKIENYNISLIDNDIKVSSKGRIVAWKFKNCDFAKKIKENSKINKDQAAVYILLYENGEYDLYVGQSGGWFKRIQRHLNEKKGIIDNIILILSDHKVYDFDHDELTYYENQLITDFKKNSKLKHFKLENNKAGSDKKTKLMDYEFNKNEYKIIKKILYFLIPFYITGEVLAPENNVKNKFTGVSQMKTKIHGKFNINDENIIIQKDQEYSIKQYEGESKIQADRFNLVLKKLLTAEAKREIKITKKNNIYKIKILQDLKPMTPSAASMFIKARSTNGWIDWIDPEGKTIDIYRKK